MLFVPIAAVALALAGTAAAAGHDAKPARGHYRRASLRAERELEASGNQTLAKRSYSGTGTYYYVGVGACGETSVDTDYLVALNTDQYGSGYPGPECFKTVSITANGVTVSNVPILDECPSCAYGSLDLSPSLFEQFAELSVGTLSITWSYDSSSDTTTTSSQTTSTSVYVAPSTSSTSQYTPTSTYVAPTSTYTPPTSTSTSSTSVYTPPSSSSETPTSTVQSSTTESTSTIVTTSSEPLSSTIALNSTSTAALSSTAAGNVTASVTGYNVTANSTATAVPAAATGNNTVVVTETSNSNDTTSNSAWVAVDELVVQLAQMIVTGAGSS